MTAVLLMMGWRAEAWASCSVTSVTGISFGDYDPLRAAPVAQVGSLTIRCGSMGATAEPPVLIDLSAGNSGTFLFRHLRKGKDSLRYNLYLDAANTQVWGDGAAGSARYPLPSGTGGDVTLPIYGRILPGQNVAEGVYTDIVSVTLVY